MNFPKTNHAYVAKSIKPFLVISKLKKVIVAFGSVGRYSCSLKTKGEIIIKSTATDSTKNLLLVTFFWASSRSITIKNGSWS